MDIRVVLLFMHIFKEKITRMQKLLELLIYFKLGVFAYLLHYGRCDVMATLLPQKENNSHCCLINRTFLRCVKFIILCNEFTL